ncbi:MAG: nucleoside hydrolase [Rhodospirillales bacterium]|nr:MAG: nucleoside hydrolase [Rhodospirillales bacterium]
MAARILIDCDPGHDDAVALLFAARHLDLLAVTTVHGNSTLENTTRNALAVLELAGIDVPVARGCAAPLAAAPTTAAHVHGASGLDGATLPPPSRRPVDAHAVDVIIDLASRHRGELVVAVIGPQTNLATALRREPRLAGWIREIAVMGGSTTGGNITPAAEFNVHCDPEAAAEVFASGAPIRMVGLNVTRRTGFDGGDIALLRAGGGRVAATIADLMAFYLGRQRAAHGVDVAPMHDVCALMPYAFPALVGFVETDVRVELAGTHTRGMTLCDMRRLRPGAGRIAAAPNASVAVDIDSRAVVERALDAVLSYR